MTTHTIRLDGHHYSDGSQKTVTPVYYGLSRGRYGTHGHMLVHYNPVRGTAYLYGQPYGHNSIDFAHRILHGDILAMGSHQFRVHCPADWRQSEPALLRIDAEVVA